MLTPFRRITYSPYQCIEEASCATLDLTNQFYVQLCAHFLKLDKSIVTKWISEALGLQKLMDEEIKQITLSNTPNHVHDLFRYLIHIRSEKVFCKNLREFITQTADDFNDIYDNYIKIQMEIHDSKEKNILYRIESDTLNEYIILIEPAITNIIKILDYYINRYNKGLIGFNAVSFLVDQPQHKNLHILPASNKALPPSSPNVKIKANITIKQLLYLFKALIDTNIISHPDEIKELHKIIASNFYTGKAEEISAEQLQKKWSEIQKDPKLAAFWSGKFIDLHNQAKKDNPNNIKL